MNKRALHIKLIGKILFPRQAPWQQAAKASTVFCSIAVGVLTGGALAALMLLHSSAGVK
jgi:hypothetical protein